MKLIKLINQSLSLLKEAEGKLYEASDNCDDYHAESKLANVAGKIKNAIQDITNIVNEE